MVYPERNWEGRAFQRKETERMISDKGNWKNDDIKAWTPMTPKGTAKYLDFL